MKRSALKSPLMSSAIDLLFHPVENARRLADACALDFGVCKLVMQHIAPPEALLRALLARTMKECEMGHTPATLSGSVYRSVNINGPIYSAMVRINLCKDPLNVSVPLSNLLLTSMYVLHNYCDKIMAMMMHITTYEAEHPHGSLVISLSDTQRMNVYGPGARRPDLDHVQDLIEELVHQVALWWWGNPSALFCTPMLGVKMFLRLVVLAAHTRRPTFHLLYGMFEAPDSCEEWKKELKLDVTTVLTSKILSTRAMDLPLEPVQTSLVLLAFLLLVAKHSELSLLVLQTLHDTLNMQPIPIPSKSTRLHSYIVERAMLHALCGEGITGEHIAMCVNILKTHSSQHPNRRVLNLTHQTLTSVIGTTDPYIIVNKIRRLVAASSVNRADFMRYYQKIPVSERELWWKVMAPDTQQQSPHVDTEEDSTKNDYIVEHPTISESCIIMGKDQCIRLETILRDVHDNTVKDPYTNETWTWDEFIENTSDVVRMETYY
jgi:hypothetical protein